ncbi:hypothetical protein [Deinococcus koreensis]|uniref:DUF3618 domain-containing protein n=1 Tax=Deinococcus koreensis TaxID=2054903 RepID=A0A2K3UU89_9DEIO|nr:hypothetical protein [Deinococcus koreensis]PNY80105.1 hypothetical protein CVO96_00930 [Deinococcus koreensis]
MAGDSQANLTEREEARERLRASIDALTERASLQVQMEKEPLKMLGGASAVGALLGMVVGRQFRRSRKIYVDAASPVKHQKALIRAQNNKSGSSVGGALVATLGTLALKTLTEKVITPRLEGYANGLLERSGQAPAGGSGKAGTPGPQASRAVTSPAAAFEARRSTPLAASLAPASAPSSPPAVSPARASDTASTPAGLAPVTGAPATAPATGTPAAHAGVLPHPPSQVEAKAQGSVIDPEQMANPNRR